MSDTRIESVRAWLDASDSGASPDPPTWDQHPASGPLSHLGFNRSSGFSPDASGGECVVQVRCADGVSGVGYARHGHSTAYLVDHALAPLLASRDASDVEGLYDAMLRLASEYGGAGHILAAISGVDCALWDIRGKRADLPVYKVINPGASDQVALYATGPGVEPFLGRGFRGVKPWISDGTPTEVAEFLHEQRRLLDADQFLAIDCFMGLDVDRVLALHRLTAALDLRWIEEPLLPWMIEELTDLRRQGVPVASGEHNSLHELARLVRSEAVDVIQPELNWNGGVTGPLGIARLARRRGIATVPHAGGLIAYHFAAALGPDPALHDDLPLAEYSFYPNRDLHAPFLAYHPCLLGSEESRAPVDGIITLPTSPGWGYELNTDVLATVDWARVRELVRT